MGPGSVSAGIHAGLGRSGKWEGVLIDKAGQEGVLRESPQLCCPLSPHRALAATFRSRSLEVPTDRREAGEVIHDRWKSWALVDSLAFDSTSFCV